MALTSEFRAALERLALACAAYEVATGSQAVLVGGASATLYTAGAFASGDFDLVAGHDAAFNDAMRAHGFLPEDRANRLRIGWYHPAHPEFGFQQVSGSLFDGRAEPARLRRLAIRGGGSVTLPSVEDMIADRLGQHAVASPTDRSRLLQAQGMLDLAEGLDREYLKGRVREEGGDLGLLSLGPQADSRERSPEREPEG